MAKAMQDGAPVEDYCYWSLMDNFEWIDGYGPKFGLYQTDFTTQKRTPRGSAKLFHDIVQNQGF